MLLPTAHLLLTKRRRTVQLALHSPPLAVSSKLNLVVQLVGERLSLPAVAAVAQQELASLPLLGLGRFRWPASAAGCAPAGPEPSCRGSQPWSETRR